MNFGQWLKTQEDAPGTIGDFARDHFAKNGAGKKCCNRFTSYKGIRSHVLTAHHPCDGAMEALESAYQAYLRTQVIPNSESESEFQEKVIRLAIMLDWKVCHFRPGRTIDGEWRTPVAGDGKGFPDLVLARKPLIIFAELKSESGKMSIDQDEWARIIRECGGYYYLWRPSNWEDIVRVLGAKP